MHCRFRSVWKSTEALASQAFCVGARLQMRGDPSAQDQVLQVPNFRRQLGLTVFTSCRQCQIDCLSQLLWDTPVLTGFADVNRSCWRDLHGKGVCCLILFWKPSPMQWQHCINAFLLDPQGAVSYMDG